MFDVVANSRFLAKEEMAPLRLFNRAAAKFRVIQNDVAVVSASSYRT